MANAEQPIGVILAGGAGVRMGGAKPTVALRGSTLLHYPLDAMRAALGEVAVIAKAETLLPGLRGAMIWIEPDLPRHPLLGRYQHVAAEMLDRLRPSDRYPNVKS